MHHQPAHATFTIDHAVAHAGDGSMVIGAASGSVHLYAPEPLRQWSIANTEFNAGAAVTHLDITYDGHWVLATTDHFLVIAPTQFRVCPQPCWPDCSVLSCFCAASC